MSDSFMRDAVMEEAVSMENILRTISPDLVMTYSEFKDLLLPLLRNIGPKFDYISWLNVVRNESVCVVVTDDATGEEKYRIPQLCAPVPYNDNSGYLHNVTTDLKNIMANNPLAGASLLYNGLSKLNQDDEALDKAALLFASKINIILKDHDIPLIELNAEPPKEDTPETKLEDDGVTVENYFV